MLSGLKFDKAILAELFSEEDPVTYEMALGSYLHKNPLVGGIVAWRMKLALGFVGDIQGKRILDYGCGLGILFLQLEEGRNQLYGTDLDVLPAGEVLNVHQRKDVELFPLGNIEEYIPDNSLDVITSLEVLEHVDDLLGTVMILKRKLKQGGKLIISGPTENGFYRLLRRIAGFSGEYHHRNIYQIVDLISEKGFVIDRRRTIPLPGPLDVFAIYRFIKTDQDG